jgi:hypothetical protein
VSALELNIGSIQESNTYAAPAECDFEQEDKTPVAAEKVGPIVPRLIAPAAELVEVDASNDGSKQDASNEAPSAPEAAAKGKANCPDLKPARTSPKFIVIDGSKFLDINHGKDIYHAAVAGKLLNSGTVDRLAFFACWCAIAAKLRAGRVRHPERMMRFLLDNRKAMSAYPDQAAEQKARAAIRHLWPDKPYNPHG